MHRFVRSALFLALMAPVAARADVVIGVSAPLTGPAASVAEISMPGLKQAAADINAKGGIASLGGQKIQLQILDDACDPKQAVMVANKLAAQKIVAVISTSCSGAVKAAAPAYEEENIPFVASVATNPDLTKQGYATLFRAAYLDTQDADKAVEFMAAKFPGKKIAIVDDKSVWGNGMAAMLAESLKNKGFSTVDRIQLTAGEQDYSAVVNRLKEAKYDVVYPALFMREDGLLVRQMSDAGYHPAIISALMVAMTDATSIMGPAQEGVYFTRVALSPPALAISRRLDPKAENTGIYNLQSYAAVEILAQAIAKAGTKPADLLQELRGDTFQTSALGPVKFDRNGDISDMKFEVMQLKGGKAVPADGKK